MHVVPVSLGTPLPHSLPTQVTLVSESSHEPRLGLIKLRVVGDAASLSAAPRDDVKISTAASPERQRPVMQVRSSGVFVYANSRSRNARTTPAYCPDKMNIFESNVAQVGDRATETAHRKVELQSPDDLTYLIANVSRAAREKLDKHLPPDAAPEGEDAMRRRVEQLVDDVRLPLWSGIGGMAADGRGSTFETRSMQRKTTCQ